MWPPTQSDTLWAKYSRAPRMPARGEQAVTLRSAYSPPSVSGKELRIRRVSNSDEVSQCRLLLIPDLEEARSGAILRWVYGQPILTVSDAEGFTRLGCGIELARSGGRVQFVINTDALSRSGPTPSSQMLRLAQRVIGGER